MSMLKLIRAGAQLDQAGTTDLKDSTLGVASAGLLVQAYCTQVVQQPAIVMPDSMRDRLPLINDHLKTARDNASDYLTNIQPTIIAVVTDVGGYASQFTNFHALITGRIDAWKGGSLTARAEALQLLRLLQTDLEKKQLKIVGVQGSLGGFQGKLNTDVSNFNTALSNADTIIRGDRGLLAALQQQLDDIRGQISGAIAGIVISGLAILGGAMMIAVGALATFASAGAAKAVVVVGVAVVAGGVAGLTASSIALATLNDTRANLLLQQAQLEANYLFLENFKSTIGTLSSSARTASQQLTNMNNAWTILGGNMGNVVNAVQNAQTYSDIPLPVLAFLNTAGSQWTDVLTSVRTIQSQMSGVQTTILRDGAGLGPLNSQSIRALAA
jgi:non-hemolytic enterotoxin B/C